jgi:hypothetical protein
MSNLRWRGEFNILAAYIEGDVVRDIDDGITYVCVKDTMGFPPWTLDSGFEKMAAFDLKLVDGGLF